MLFLLPPIIAAAGTLIFGPVLLDPAFEPGVCTVVPCMTCKLGSVTELSGVSPDDVDVVAGDVEIT
jgi:hypothetical protein